MQVGQRSDPGSQETLLPSSHARKLFGIVNNLLGRRKETVLPTNQPASELVDMFTRCSNDKIANIHSNYLLIKDVIYNIKRPVSHAPEIPRLLLPQRFRYQVINRAHKEVGHLSYATVTRIAEAYVWPLMRQAFRNRITKCPRHVVYVLDEHIWPPPGKCISPRVQWYC